MDRTTEQELNQLITMVRVADPENADCAQAILLSKYAALRAKLEAAEQEIEKLTALVQMARGVWEFKCSCGSKFGSLEEHDQHVRLIHAPKET